YESVDTGLYLRRGMPVRCGARRLRALVYVASRQGEGIPRPGYINLVVAAAREWELPEPYIRSLARWAGPRWGAKRPASAATLEFAGRALALNRARRRASRWRGVRPADTGEIG